MNIHVTALCDESGTLNHIEDDSCGMLVWGPSYQGLGLEPLGGLRAADDERKPFSNCVR